MVYFGGNVQGVATLENLKYIKGGDVMVMELDSWILQGFKDIKYSPDIAIFTNIMSDHMNYYKGYMRDYFLDKANIFLYQKEQDIFVTTEILEKEIENYLSPEDFKKYSKNKNLKNILNENEIQEINNNFKSNLLGDHNKINVALAILACQKFGVDGETIKEALQSFAGVPGRLEKIKTINGVDYINDTCATTGDAGIAALESFSIKKIILITGGRDKELDINNYANKIIDFKSKNIIKEIILLNDDTTTGTKKLLELFEKYNFTEYILKSNLHQAVIFAKENSLSGNIILFTPAFASFGMFQNEYDRGDKFVKIVENTCK